MIPTAFISHSHRDREIATTIDGILRDYGVTTFLDQEEILGGQCLSQRIRAGIEACTVLVLLWSKYSSQSKWVTLEWERALARGKRILPYALDDTTYPAPLRDLVYVDVSDLRRGNDGLLRGVFFPGKPPQPLVARLEIVPGRWRLEVTEMGFTAQFAFELRANGQLTGQASFGGFTAGVTGEWEYDFATRLFTARTVSTFQGRTQIDDMTLWITRREGNMFYGHGAALQPFVLTRLA